MGAENHGHPGMVNIKGSGIHFGTGIMFAEKKPPGHGTCPGGESKKGYKEYAVNPSSILPAYPWPA